MLRPRSEGALTTTAATPWTVVVQHGPSAGCSSRPTPGSITVLAASGATDDAPDKHHEPGPLERHQVAQRISLGDEEIGPLSRGDDATVVETEQLGRRLRSRHDRPARRQTEIGHQRHLSDETAGAEREVGQHAV